MKNQVPSIPSQTCTQRSWRTSVWMPSHRVLAALLWLATASWILAGAAGPLSGGSGGACNRTCGGVDIPYPFGIGPDNCSMPSRNMGFHLYCDDTGNGVHKPFLDENHTLEVLNISLKQGQVRVLNHISYSCYNAEHRSMMHQDYYFRLVKPFWFSDTSNKFTVVGCRTLAYIGDPDYADTFMTGCVAVCSGTTNMSVITNDSCSGKGCCQTAIPRGLQYSQVWFDERYLNTSGMYETPCSYAVLMEESKFTFSTSYLTPSTDFNSSYHGRVPVLLDWAVGNQTCEVARTKPGYACVSSSSECHDVGSGRGYICNCTKGFQGNPYLTGGCQDIDECKDNHTYPCYGICYNKLGTYDCSCPTGTQGNASIAGCHKESLPLGLGARLAIGIAAGVFVAVIAFLATKVILHKRSMKRQALFQQHGGQLLKEMLKAEGNHIFNIYDRGDIMKATSNFSKANIVGEGVHGTVYKAILPVGGAETTVVVKRCKEIDQSRKEEFVRELVILCRVSHPNIVRLLGCCLEFEAPMLVYEFEKNGNLNHLLHLRKRGRVTLATRLKIARESAEALAHLHSLPHPVHHGDVKPENILLADGWIAKVSDFGCSTINDNVQVVPKGTLAYLDPEFVIDLQLTDKNDVYSFGVVIVELLTGKKPQSKEGKNLTLMFQESMRLGTLAELLDADIAEENSMVVIHQAAELGSRCIAVPGTARPSMEQVAQELRRLQDQVPESSQLPLELEDVGATEMAMSSGYPTTQSQSDTRTE